MARTSKKLQQNFKKDAINILFGDLKNINLVDDVEKFLEKFFTTDERELILRRIIVMDFLNKNIKYRDIKKALEVSSNTISKVRDIIENRGYGVNPNRKRKYSPSGSLSGNKKRKVRNIFPNYKGARSII